MSNNKEVMTKQHKNKWIIITIVLITIVAIGIGLVITNNDSTNTIPPYDSQSPARVGAVTLIVSDLSSMSEFYQEEIGFQLLKSEENRVELTVDGEKPLLILEEEKDAVSKPIRTTGLYHFALLLPDERTLGQYLLYLNEKGYLQDWADHQYSKALYLADPEGNGIEFYADLPSDEWIQDGNGGYVGGTYQLDTASLVDKAKNDQWTGLPENTRMGHMHLQVSDLEESEKFYVDVLEFNIVAQSDSHLFVSKDGYHHHIGMNIWMGQGIPTPPDNAVGLKNYTILLMETEWNRVKENLMNENIDFEEVENVIVVKDPSDIEIQIVY